MFHLLVNYQGWPESQGSLGNDRLYFNPNQEPGSLLFTDGRLDVLKVSKIPALLVSETGGSGPQFARVAFIRNVSRGHKETTIHYVIDHSIPPISNADLELHRAELNSGRFGFTTSCWTLCDVDLFKLLLLNQQRHANRPKLFSIASATDVQDDLVAVMMPFKAEFKAVFETLESCMSAIHMTCQRADKIWEDNIIIQDIVNLIARARVVICDCSGKNPNVFYEAGIAHTLGKEVIFIAQSMDDIPFDVRHIRAIPYHPNGEGLQDLSQKVQSRVQKIVGL